MVEVALGAAGALALTEGVKFLYAQAGEALKWWRERKDKKDAAPEIKQIEALPPPAAFPDAEAGADLNSETADSLVDELRDLGNALSGYVTGIEEVDPTDLDLMQTVDAFRNAVEAVTGRRYTFVGEVRDSRPEATGEANIDEIKGDVAGLRARSIVAGRATGRVTGKTVDEGGVAIGLDVGTIG
jgi:hypothetical protein